MSEIKEVTLTGAALKQAHPRRGGRSATRKMRGGEAPIGADDAIAMASAAKAASMTANAMRNFGPDAISQKGGDVLNTAVMANAAAQTQAALKNFGPDAINAQKGGTGAGISTAIASTSVPGNTSSVVAYNSTTSAHAAAIGGKSNIRLAPPKQRTKITLKAPRHKKEESTSVTQAAGTRKVRKIALRTRGVTARLAKAKRATRDAHKAPISLIKNRLEKYGVIKKGSKAPDSMLRTMYADLLITKKGL